MRRYTCFLTLCMAALLLASNLHTFGHEANTFSDITVLVDKQEVSFGDVAPQIIHDRTMVPVRPLAEALGADIDWNDEAKSVAITTESQYAVLVIDADVMQYGQTAKDADGRQIHATTETFALDSPPVIVDDRSLFPASAIAKAFDADVQWDDETKTVTITTAAEPTVIEDSVFSDNEYFQEVSGKRLEDMHAGKAKFGVVIYNGEITGVDAQMLTIKEAAKNAKFKLYGFDISSTRFNNPENLKWPWELLDKTSVLYPMVVLSYEGRKDEVLPVDITGSALQEKLVNMALAYPVLPTPTPLPTPIPLPTPRPPERQYEWTEVNLAEEMKADTFLYLVFYDDYNVRFNYSNFPDRDGNNDRSKYSDIVQTVAKYMELPVYYHVATIYSDGPLYTRESVHPIWPVSDEFVHYSLFSYGSYDKDFTDAGQIRFPAFHKPKPGNDLLYDYTKLHEPDTANFVENRSPKRSQDIEHDGYFPVCFVSKQLPYYINKLKDTKTLQEELERIMNG